MAILGHPAQYISNTLTLSVALSCSTNRSINQSVHLLMKAAQNC